jgi:hypothetical protein
MEKRLQIDGEDFECVTSWPRSSVGQIAVSSSVIYPTGSVDSDRFAHRMPLRQTERRTSAVDPDVAAAT